MKKVAFIIQCLTKGGAERTISNLSLILKDKLDVYIIVYDGERITYPYAGTLIDLKLPPKKGAINKLINVFQRIKAVRKIKKQYNFDCVISFMFGGNIVNVLSGHKGKIITSARNYMSVYGTGIKQKIRERFIAAKSDKVVALSKMVEVDLNDTFGIPKKKTTTIYNPCDINRIKLLASKECDYVFEDDVFYFVTVGRLTHQKGQWNLLKAFSVLKKKVDKCKLLVLGTGDLEDKLAEYAKELNIADSVVFTGFKENPYAYIKRSDCFVLSSLHEGLGNVILEAMACEVPVVSTDCLAGPRELIAPESDIRSKANSVEVCSCGVLTPVDNNEVWGKELFDEEVLLAEAMEIICKDASLREKVVANANIRVNEFSNDNISEQWINLIQE